MLLRAAGAGRSKNGVYGSSSASGGASRLPVVEMLLDVDLLRASDLSTRRIRLGSHAALNEIKHTCQ